MASVARGYTLDRIVEGSGFHTANGLSFGPDGRLYVASVMGESIFALDIETGSIEVAVPAYKGESDDLLFTPDGKLIWTALLEGSVRMRDGDGAIRDLATGLPGANSIALTRDGKRLFVGQVFMGEGLWEIDLRGREKPRLVVDDTGGLNAAQFGPDGMLYAPSWERGQVVRINPESGRTEILADGFQKPGAVRFDPRDGLHVLDDATGELFALDSVGATYVQRLVAALATSTDNVIFGTTGLAYVSNMADNAIHEVDPANGRVRKVVGGRLGFPRSICLTAEAGGDRLHIADSCAYRTLDTTSFELRDVARAVASPLKFPTAVSVVADTVLLTGEAFGVVQMFSRTGEHIRDIEGFEKPGAAMLLRDGSFVVTEPEAGRITWVRGEERVPLVSGLSVPCGLADPGDGTFLVTECTAGRLLRVHLADGKVEQIADRLGTARAVACGPGGSVVVLDTARGRVLSIEPATGRTAVLAEGLAAGFLTEPYTRSGGIAVGSDGIIYVSADAENAIDRIRTI